MVEVPIYAVGLRVGLLSAFGASAITHPLLWFVLFPYLHLPALHGVSQRAHHRLLANHVGEGTGTAPAIQGLGLLGGLIDRHRPPESIHGRATARGDSVRLDGPLRRAPSWRPPT